MKNQEIYSKARSACCGILLLVSLAFPAFAGDRVALVIGNSEYVGEDLLKSPASDARILAQMLESAGFVVVRAENTTLKEFREAVQSFATSAREAKVAWFYFAGRSFQLNEENYLVPVDAKVTSEADIESLTLSLDDVISAMKLAGTPLKVLVLDCSRENPSASGLRPRVLPGLCAVGAPEGTIIAYGAAPGEVVRGGVGPDSGYTSALVTALKKGGLDIRQVFERTGTAVSAATQRKQQPWMVANLKETFVLVEGSAVTASPPLVSPTILPNPEISAATPQPTEGSTTVPLTGTGTTPSSAPSVLPPLPSWPKTGPGTSVPTTNPVASTPSNTPTDISALPPLPSWPKSGSGTTMPSTTPVAGVVPNSPSVAPVPVTLPAAFQTGLGMTSPTTPVSPLPSTGTGAPRQLPTVPSSALGTPTITATPAKPSPALTPVTTDTAGNRVNTGSQNPGGSSSSIVSGQPDFSKIGYYKNSEVFKDGPFEVVGSVTVHHDLVKEMQRQLLGEGKNTGWMNSETQNAILRLQKDRGIPPTGRIDYQTSGLLKLKLQNSGTTGSGSFSAVSPTTGGPLGSGTSSIPSGSNVPGRAGLVYSPFSPGIPINAAGKNPGEFVTDPHSKQIFMLPDDFVRGKANSDGNDGGRRKGTIIPGKSYNSLNGTTMEGSSSGTILPVGTVHDETLKKFGLKRR